VPIDVFEKATGVRMVSGDRPGTELSYGAIGSEVRADVRAAVLAAVPVVADGFPLADVLLNEVEAGVWDVTPIYRFPSDSFSGPSDVGESSEEFSTGGGTERVKYGLEETLAVSLAGTIADGSKYSTALGVVEDGENITGVEGVDIVVPEYRFSETHVLDAGDVDSAYRLALANLTGRVNDATFRGFDAGEVLFLGATGRRAKLATGPGDWTIRFEFARRPNEEDLEFVVDPDEEVSISGIYKQGWDRLEVHVKPVSSNVAIGNSPPGVYPQLAMVRVVKIYRDGDFDALGIG